MHMSVVSVVNRDPAAVYAHAIRFATGKGFAKLAPWNHTAVAFFAVDCDDDLISGSDVYFESWLRKNPETGKNGFQGPLPWHKLTKWRADSPDTHDYRVQKLPYPPEVCRRVYHKAHAMSGKVGYAKFQIWHNAKRNLFGAGSVPAFRSMTKMTCSESVAILIDHAAWLNAILFHNVPGGIDRASPMAQYLQIGARNVFEDVTPSGKIGLHEAIEQWLRDVQS